MEKKRLTKELGVPAYSKPVDDSESALTSGRREKVEKQELGNQNCR